MNRRNMTVTPQSYIDRRAQEAWAAESALNQAHKEHAGTRRRTA